MAKRKLLVEGWRFLPHSYAMVNQWQLLALAQRPEIELRVRDLPLYARSWQTGGANIDAARDAILRAIPTAEPGFRPEVTLRIAAPFDLSPPPSGRLAVFCTSEYHSYTPETWTLPPQAVDWANRPDLAIVTPSRWSAQGLARIGIPEAAIHVVPHGVDSALFAPDRARRAATRKRLGIGEGIVFMNAGAMTGNKGVDLLLQAFAGLCRRRSDVYLLVKGSDDLYRSNARLGALVHGLGPHTSQRLARRMIYGGARIGASDMAALYNAADVYVSPYRAEGFNLPVLEAMASGLAVICTAGGPTDEFMPDGAGWRVSSRLAAVAAPPGPPGVQLLADAGQLLSLMEQAAADAGRRRALGAAARQAAASLSWDAAVARLLQVLFPPQGPA